MRYWGDGMDDARAIKMLTFPPSMDLLQGK
jgi:hypothetical protein